MGMGSEVTSSFANRLSPYGSCCNKMGHAAVQILLFSVSGGGFAILTRVIFAVAGALVGVGTAVDLARGVAVELTGFAAGALVVGVAAVASAGTAVATGLGVAVASLPHATINAANSANHRGFTNHRRNRFVSLILSTPSKHLL
jgi:hypothetical protein